MELHGLIVMPTHEWSEADGEKYLWMSVSERLDYIEAQVKQELPQFIKEFNRLCVKYGERGDMTEEQVYGMDYFEDFADELVYYGGKNLAQIELYKIGEVPANEVELWNRKDEVLSY